jgi:hypothetical protein
MSITLTRVFEDNGFMQSEYEPSNKILFIYHKGIPVHEKLVEGWETIMKFAANKPIELIFSNGMAVKGTFTKSNDFLKGVAIPFFNRHHLKFFATVMSGDVFTIFGVNQMLKLMSLGNNKFEMKVFKSPVEAKNWLELKKGQVIAVPQFYMREDRS